MMLKNIIAARWYRKEIRNELNWKWYISNFNKDMTYKSEMAGALDMFDFVTELDKWIR
jgi:hypothetical protein